MDRSRLADAAFDALLLAFALGAVLAPPDPVTQLLYAAPAFVGSLAVLARYRRRSPRQWWKRYLVFFGGVFTVALARGVVALAVDSLSAPAVRTAFSLAGVAFGAWLAFFGGLARLRGEVEA